MSETTRAAAQSPGLCPFCGAKVSADSAQAYGDKPCPQCGKALWFCTLPEGGVWFHDAQKAAAVRARVVQVVVKQLGADPTQVTDEKSFAADFGADSLDVVELVMSLEEEFGVKIPDEEAEKAKTVGLLVNWLLLHLP